MERDLATNKVAAAYRRQEPREGWSRADLRFADANAYSLPRCSDQKWVVSSEV